MSEFDELKLTFVRNLPERVIDMIADVIRCKATGEKRVQSLAGGRMIVTMTLGHGRFEPGDLVKLAEAVGADTSDKSSGGLKNAIFHRMLDIRLRTQLGDKFLEFEEYVQHIRQKVPQLIVLRSFPVDDSQSAPAAYFNPNSLSENEWLHVDMSIHPMTDMRSNRVLKLVTDREQGGTVEWGENLEQPAVNWVPLFPHEYFELPPIEPEYDTDEEFPFDIPDDEELVEAYEILASTTCLMTGYDYHIQEQGKPYRGVYAQLGGSLYAWVEQSIEEQTGNRVVLRTHANSEPWVEVAINDSGEYRVMQHIT
ncbi:hypothetical protein NHH03_20270 [Stieleria sp. TO1_6]|uniref:hypothetical protein n=1 Tax=Stieleria tagensis TaxID=2956795 RepID=UPI00209AD474|nr:hypothetical protein [Stieleria tagensis]MCO8124091.1 hypothetical protein [Stieleria tagensis]